VREDESVLCADCVHEATAAAALVSAGRWCTRGSAPSRARRAKQDEPDEHEEDPTVVLSSWHSLGSEYLNRGDALPAAGVEASLRAAREALLDVRRGRPPDEGPGE
jgi:hypothetical protein